MGPGVGDSICNQDFPVHLDKDNVQCSVLSCSYTGVGTGWVIILLPFFPPTGVSQHASEKNNHPEVISEKRPMNTTVTSLVLDFWEKERTVV